MKIIYSIFVLLLFYGYLPESVSIIWPCQSTDNCSIVLTATCSPIQHNCRCPAGFEFSKDVTKCLKKSAYGESCQESVQCSHMLAGADCRDGVCTCAEADKYIRGRCRKLMPIGSFCDETVDCDFGYDRESVTCKLNKCQCSDDFYSRTENICRRKSMLVNSVCVVNEDCQGPNLKCDTKEFLCVTSVRNIGVQTEPILNKINDKIQKKKSEGTQVNITYSRINQNKDEDDKKFGDECDQNGQACKGLFHSVCRNNFCNCESGYYEKGKMCKAELGEQAANKDDCEDNEFIEFRQGKCLCVYNRFYSPNLRVCTKPISAFNQSCTQNSQCSPFGETYCSTVVRPRICNCYEYASFDEKTETCIRKVGLGGYCNKQCTIENSVCNDKSTCVCKESYLEQNNTCKPGHGQICTTKDECAIENSDCTTDAIVDIVESTPNLANSIIPTCQCKNGYVFIPDKQECLKKASKYEDDCIETEQCKPLLGELSECSEEKCVCKANTQHNDGKCFEKKEIGENCARSSECFIETDKDKIECRNAVCNCKLDYTPDVEKQQCIKPSIKSSNGRPSPFKIITMLLTVSAVLITGSAIKEAYYDR